MFTKKKEQALNEEIARLKYEIADLKEIIKTQELMNLRRENARLKEIENLTKSIRFNLKSVAYIEDENKILVKYEIPNVKINLDSNNNPVKNNFFYASNRLQCISLEDMKKIQKVIDSVKRK